MSAHLITSVFIVSPFTKTIELDRKDQAKSVSLFNGIIWKYVKWRQK